MDTEKLKSQIYKQLDRLDEQGLQMVNDMISQYTKQAETEDGWDTLSEEEKAAIEEGLEQVEKGMTIPYDEVRKRVHKILSQYGLPD